MSEPSDSNAKGGFAEQVVVPEHNPAALPVRKAIVYSGLGEKDQAFANLEKAFQQRSPQLYNLQFLPGFDPLRSDPRYKDLVRRMSFPE